MNSFSPELHAAVAFLGMLRRGDTVRVTRGGNTHDLTVYRAARRSDGPHGDYESLAVTVTHGPGRYNFDISAEHIAPRKPGMQPVVVELISRAEAAA